MLGQNAHFTQRLVQEVRRSLAQRHGQRQFIHHRDLGDHRSRLAETGLGMRLQIFEGELDIVGRQLLAVMEQNAVMQLEGIGQRIRIIGVLLDQPGGDVQVLVQDEQGVINQVGNLIAGFRRIRIRIQEALLLIQGDVQLIDRGGSGRHGGNRHAGNQDTNKQCTQ